MRKVPLKDALGLPLGHDITEIKPDEKIKRRAFRRGHIITGDDIEKLLDLGRESIYVRDDESSEVHEDDAAMITAPLAAGENIEYDPEPSEGKISFYASCSGLFKVDIEMLYKINSLEITSLPTLHNNFPVKKGKQVAAFRIIPLTCEKEIIDKVRDILNKPLISVMPYIFKRSGIIVTGNEVYEGRIKDGFIPRISELMNRYGIEVSDTAILPDVKSKISAAADNFISDCDIIFVTGGSSVDPDDVTYQALVDAGIVFQVKGNPVQPGNNFSIGYKDDTVFCIVPAAALFFSATALNVFLPRLLSGEKIEKEDFYQAGHGGLCHFCETCHFPVCPFSISV